LFLETGLVLIFRFEIVASRRRLENVLGVFVGGDFAPLLSLSPKCFWKPRLFLSSALNFSVLGGVFENVPGGAFLVDSFTTGGFGCGWLPNVFGSGAVLLLSNWNPDGFSPFEFCPPCDFPNEPRFSL